MIDLRNLFKNFFNTSKISDDTLRKGCQDHLARLAASNQNGQYTQMIADTTAVYKAFCIAIDAEDVNLATQQASTLNVDNHLDEFRKSISRYEGAVRAEFGADSAEYQEFFPHGLTEYSLCNKSNAEMLMERVDILCRKYASQLSNNMVALFARINQNYDLLRSEQLQYIGTTSVRKQQTAQSRTVLEERICKNLLLIAADNIGKPELLTMYIDQSIFRPNKAKDDGSVEDEISPNGIVTLENRGLRDNTEIKIKNKSAATVFIGIYSEAGTMDTSTAARLQPNETKSFVASELGDASAGFLNAKNVSLTETARLEYLIM